MDIVEMWPADVKADQHWIRVKCQDGTEFKITECRDDMGRISIECVSGEGLMIYPERFDKVDIQQV